jgi:hypothetical protein
MWVVLIVVLSTAVLPGDVLSRNLRATDAIQHSPCRAEWRTDDYHEH